MPPEGKPTLSVAEVGLLRAWIEQCCERKPETWLLPSENGKPIRRDNIWPRYMLPKLQPENSAWATFQVMRRTFATWAKKAGVNAHTRSAQMGNTVDVNENEYAVSDFKTRREAVRKLEAALTIKVKDNGESSACEALQTRG